MVYTARGYVEAVEAVALTEAGQAQELAKSRRYPPRYLALRGPSSCSYTEQPVIGGSTRTLHCSLCTMYVVSLKYLSKGSCLFLDVPTLLCRTGFTGWVMVSHNSIQTAFKIADLALHAVTLLTFHARIQYIYCYQLVAIMSTCYQLVAVESACMGQTDAPAGGVVRMLWH